MSKLRLLCTADLHLGRSSTGFCPDGVDVSSLGAWQRIVHIAVSQEADALLVAGDIFDGSAAYLETRLPFLEGLRQLQSKNIPVIAVAGNHDFNALPLLARAAPSNFYFLGKGASWENRVIETANGGVQLVAWSFATEMVHSSQLAFLSRPSTDLPVVGLLHADINPQSPYHPITSLELEGKADAWVLGHIHKPNRISPNMFYPGSPQALDFGPGERGIHGVVWLEFLDGVPTVSEVVPVSTVRFEQLELSIEPPPNISGWDIAMDTLQKKCLALETENSATEVVNLRTQITIQGEELSREAFPGAAITYLDRHSIEVTSVRHLKNLDPWNYRDLRDVAGEAARLLLGARALAGEFPYLDQVEQSWIESARRLVDEGANDILTQFDRTLGSVRDSGEGTFEPLDELQALAKSHEILIRELESELQEAIQ